MAVRLRAILQRPGCAVSDDEALGLLAGMLGLVDILQIDPFPSIRAPVPVNDHAFERLADLIKCRHKTTIDSTDLAHLLLTPGDPVSGKIRKFGPFCVSRLTPEYPLLSHLLQNAIRQMSALPDFSDDKKIFVMSDFGGEHASAAYNTYSFIVLAQDKIGVFESKMRDLRKRHGILHPFSEFAYKDLRFGPRSRALPEFLSLIDSYIHGAVITLAVEKSIETLFGPSKAEAHAFLVSQLDAMGFGKWKGRDAEKLSRVCHTLAVLVSTMASPGQHVLWYCDKDTINEDGGQRTFSHTQEFYKAVWSMYATQPLEVLGFARSFEDKTYLDDLLSIADFAAGVVQDILRGHVTGSDIPGGDEKLQVIRWAVTPARFLSKINIQISRMENGELGSGLVAMSLREKDLISTP